jgi:hypothetical protein
MLPLSLSAATLSFSPGSGSYQVGSTVMVSIYTNSSGASLNALSGVVSYPTDVLEVVSVSKNQSIISLWVQEPSFSNNAGTVNFEGIVLNPGYTGANGKILSITFKVKAVGQPAVVFSAGSILANDGEGSEILTSKGQAQFTTLPATIITPVVEESPTTPEHSTGNSNNELEAIIPEVISATHPPDAWSKQTTGVFNFTLTDDVVALRLLVDDDPVTVPVVTYTPPIHMREISDLTEGVSYLHVQYKTAAGWGTVLHYKLHIDTTTPESISVKEVAPGTFIVGAKDASSDISHYEIQIDGGDVSQYIDEGSHVYSAPIQAPGAHLLQVKAFDMAGNFIVTTLNFVTNTPPESAVVLPDFPAHNLYENALVETGAHIITILSVVIPFVALVFLLVALLYALWRAHGGLKRRIDKEVLEARVMVDKAFALLQADLVEDIHILEKANAKRKLTREEAKILKRLQKNIEEAKQAITKEINDITEETQ